jgi:hypothetical protein
MGEARQPKEAAARAVVQVDRAAPEPLNERAQALVAKGLAGQQVTLGEALGACPYRTVVGAIERNAWGFRAQELVDRCESVIAILGPEPEPISDEMISDALAVLMRGGSVLIMAARWADRDFANRELFEKGMLGLSPARGAHERAI